MALKILAVDDEPEILMLLKDMIEPLGCELLPVHDSREAARLIELEKFDGVIVDVKMPHLDGFELTRRIRLSRRRRRRKRWPRRFNSRHSSRPTSRPPRRGSTHAPSARNEAMPISVKLE